MKASQERNPR